LIGYCVTIKSALLFAAKLDLACTRRLDVQKPCGRESSIYVHIAPKKHCASDSKVGLIARVNVGFGAD
jgi:hypothetical protein